MPDQRSTALPRRIAPRRSGRERFIQDGRGLDFDVRDFWAWSTSDLVSNATRSQSRLSRPTYSVRKARFWDAETGEMAAEPGRASDVYVFCLLAHKDQSTIDPLDLDQWEFFVLPTYILNERKRSQHSITLPSLHRLTESIGFDELGAAVEAAGRNR